MCGMVAVETLAPIDEYRIQRVGIHVQYLIITSDKLKTLLSSVHTLKLEVFFNYVVQCHY
jgi:hypothetical protein